MFSNNLRTPTTLLIPALLAALSGCSEPVPPASDGAFYLAFVNSGVDCRIAGHNTQVGKASATELTDVKKDGVGGAAIWCLVEGGGAFNIEGYIDHEARYINFALSGFSTAATVDNKHKGSLAYASSNTGGSYSSGACDFWIAGDEEVAAGRVWMEFACPEIRNASDNSTCAISFGTIAVMNCEQ